MFNESVKRAYIESEISSKSKATLNSALTVFEAIRQLEERKDLDIAQIGCDDFYNFISSLGIINRITLRQYINTIERYREWCRKSSSIEDCSRDVFSLYDITEDMLVESARSTLFKSSIEMLDEILTLYPADNGHNGVPLVCLLWCGVDSKIVTSVKEEDVDLKKGLVFDDNGNQISRKMDEDIKRTLRIYKSTGVAYRIKPVPSKQELAKIRFYPTKNGYFITPFQPSGEKKRLAPMSCLTINSEICKAKKEYEDLHNKKMKITLKSVIRSGLFEEMYKLECSGIDVYARKNSNVIRKLFATTANGPDILLEYTLYKKAFK